MYKLVCLDFTIVPLTTFCCDYTGVNLVNQPTRITRLTKLVLVPASVCLPTGSEMGE